MFIVDWINRIFKRPAIRLDSYFDDPWASLEFVEITRQYKIALISTEWQTIMAVVVDNDDDAHNLEQSEDFIKWITGWTEVPA